MDFLSDPAFTAYECHLVHAGKPRAEDPHLAWARERLSNWGGPHHVVERPGEPEAVIEAYAREHDIDLLVMSAYGHSPIRRFIIGSTTTAMIRITNLPVLLFR